MKNLLFIYLFVSSLSMAQNTLPDLTIDHEKGAIASCSISGPSKIMSGTEYTYSIDSNLAQCVNCHDWDITGFSTPNGGAHATQVSNTDMANSIRIEGAEPGIFILRVTYFNERGCHTCQKSITVIPDCSDFEDDVEGDVTCSFNKTGEVQVAELVDVSNVWRIDWVFEQSLNGSNYSGFQFDDSNDFQVASTDPSNHFLESFTFTGTCRGGSYEELFLRRVIKITGCPAQYDTIRLISENNQPFIAVSPNPAKEEVNVFLSQLKNKSITLDLYNMQGGLVSSQKAIIANEDFLQQVKLPNTTDKMFLLKVIENGRVLETKKIVRK